MGLSGDSHKLMKVKKAEICSVNVEKQCSNFTFWFSIWFYLLLIQYIHDKNLFIIYLSFSNAPEKDSTAL